MATSPQEPKTLDLNRIRESVRTRFEQSKRVLSFEEYLGLLASDPFRYLRGGPHYLLDAIQHFGIDEVPVRGVTRKRYRIFEKSFAENHQPVVSHENVQHELVRLLTSFVRSGRADKLIVLHGPNGSAKSTFVRSLLAGLEDYSKANEGALFSFSWVFPQDSFEKATLGLGARKATIGGETDSFAALDHEKVAAVVRSELRENPLALIPHEDRMMLFDEWLHAIPAGAERDRLAALRPTVSKLELSHKNAIIFEALLNDCKGDLKRVFRHVRVERFYLSRRFRTGLVTVEPQFGVDAQLRQVTLDRSMSLLPPALQSLNLFQLEGDLVDGNRGVVEFNDLLKRPLESFKYLLGTSETGTVTLGHVMAYLDTVFIATTNDRQLEAFREHPEFNSFKARIELIKVPYLLRYSEEAKVYGETARRAAGPKELMPHTTSLLALWAVMTRLKRPNAKNKSSMLAGVLENLGPLAKAKLYDSADIPENLNDEERRELKSALEDLILEQQNQPFYEGYLGASARELKVVLQMAAQNDQFPTLGPGAVFAELDKLIRRPLDFEYLRIEPNQGYHDYEGMLKLVRQEWLNLVDREMEACLELDRKDQINESLERYVRNVMANVRKEKVKNRITGQFEEVDESLMTEFENFISVTDNREDYRRNLISRLGAWSIENPGRAAGGQALPYDKIFTDIVKRLRAKFHEQHVAKIRTMGALFVETAGFDVEALKKRPSTNEAEGLAIRVFEGMQAKFGYGPAGAKEALTELIRSRYH